MVVAVLLVLKIIIQLINTSQQLMLLQILNTLSFITTLCKEPRMIIQSNTFQNPNMVQGQRINKRG